LCAKGLVLPLESAFRAFLGTKSLPAKKKRREAKPRKTAQIPQANRCPLQTTVQINQSLTVCSTKILNSFKKIECFLNNGKQLYIGPHFLAFRRHRIIVSPIPSSWLQIGSLPQTGRA
jgi:hypothetical protein